jgi:hypothetical protein
MTEVRLSQEEVLMLHQILDDDLSDLRMEIADTDRAEFREWLKRKKDIIQHVIEELDRTHA